MDPLSIAAITSKFVGATDCAWTLYKDCKNSSEDFQRISQEVASLHVVLKEAADLLEFGNPVDLGGKSERLMVLIQGCNDTLSDIRNLLDKYESLGTQAQRKWIRVRWGLEDLADLTRRLISNTALLSSFNVLLADSSTARLEKRLAKFIEEVRLGMREGSVVSNSTILTENEENGNAWRQLKRELEDVGISETVIAENHSYISAWLSKAISNDMLIETNPSAEEEIASDSGYGGSGSANPTSYAPTVHSIDENLTASGRGNRSESFAKLKKKPKKSWTVSSITAKFFKQDKHLLQAASDGDVVKVTKFLKRGANIEARNQIGWSPLSMSCYAGFTDIVRLLLDNGANLDNIDVHGDTPESLAANRGHAGIVFMLEEERMLRDFGIRNAENDISGDHISEEVLPKSLNSVSPTKDGRYPPTRAANADLQANLSRTRILTDAKKQSDLCSEVDSVLQTLETSETLPIDKKSAGVSSKKTAVLSFDEKIMRKNRDPDTESQMTGTTVGEIIQDIDEYDIYEEENVAEQTDLNLANDISAYLTVSSDFQTYMKSEDQSLEDAFNLKKHSSYADDRSHYLEPGMSRFLPPRGKGDFSLRMSPANLRKRDYKKIEFEEDRLAKRVPKYSDIDERSDSEGITDPVNQDVHEEADETQTKDERVKRIDILLTCLRALRLAERALEPCMQRVRWKCICGHSGYFDVKEAHPGAAKDLERKLNERYIRSQASSGGPSIISPGTRSFFMQKIVNFSLILNLLKAQEDPKGLPVHEVRAQNDPSSSKMPSVPPEESRYLLLCMSDGDFQLAPKLVQPGVQDLRTDRDFFEILRQTYNTRRRKWKSLLSMRQLKEIKFVRFDLFINDIVSIPSKTCELPPKERLLPPPEYTYLPGDSAPATTPPIGPDALMHFYAHPSHADKNSSPILNFFPKRVKEPLTRDLGKGMSTGWGVHFEEGWHWNAFWVVGFGLLSLGSIVFGVAWTVLEHDVQGAFGIASFILAFVVFGAGSLKAILGGS